MRLALVWRRVRYVAIAVGVLVVLAIAANRLRSTSTTTSSNDDDHALVLSVRVLGPDAGDADRVVEISLDEESARGGALIVVDDAGRLLAKPLAFESSGGKWRAIVDARALAPHDGATFGVALLGESSAVSAVVTAMALDTTHGPDDRVALARDAARGNGVSVQRVVVSLGARGAAFDPSAIETAERSLARGDPLAALAKLDAIRGSAPRDHGPRIDAIAAEAAFAFGRVRLATTIAERGLADASNDVLLEARLLRVLVSSLAESEDSVEPPAARARLRASENARPAAIERLLDAAIDLRLAEIHDRGATGPRTADAAARVVLDRAIDVADADLARAAGMLCRAGSHAASNAAGIAALARGAAIAHANARAADEAYCAISEGDRAAAASHLDVADTQYTRALGILGDRPLPREQREAWFSRAYVAESRRDYASAAAFARRACAWVDRLLSLESDLKARETIFTNLLGYYVDVEKYAALAGHDAEAIAAGESGKARAFTAILSGAGEVDESADGAFLALRMRATNDAGDATSDDDQRALARFTASLGTRDAAIAYTMLGHDRHGHFQIAIGVVTKDKTSATIVDQPSTFRDDVAALERAVARNDAEGARASGGRLYATLVAPIADRLAGKDRLFISPHLRLHGMPWAALYDGAHPLVERFAIARVPPLVAIERAPEDDRAAMNDATAGRWLVAIDPRHPGLDPLPGFDPVADLLATRTPPIALMRGVDATANAIVGALSTADAFVYAGHASYDAARPLRSALLVAPGDGGGDRVEAARILGVDRRLAFVLLLGCETARQEGDRPSYSDETIGLPRAFLAAGARHVVGALWPVLDRDAEDFVHALLANADAGDVVHVVGAAQRCLASGRCVSRGIASWASYVVDAR